MINNIKDIEVIEVSNHIKSEQLADELNIGLSSLKKMCKEIEDFLIQHGVITDRQEIFSRNSRGQRTFNQDERNLIVEIYELSKKDNMTKKEAIDFILSEKYGVPCSEIPGNLATREGGIPGYNLDMVVANFSEDLKKEIKTILDAQAFYYEERLKKERENSEILAEEKYNQLVNTISEKMAQQEQRYLKNLLELKSDNRSNDSWWSRLFKKK